MVIVVPKHGKPLQRQNLRFPNVFPGRLPLFIAYAGHAIFVKIITKG